MACTIVVGGQYGSEGKGKVVALETSRQHSPWVVRVGGPNAGHTIDVGGKRTILRQVPAGAGHSEATLAVSAGCVVDEELLLKEVRDLNLARNRLIVDPRAVLLSTGDRVDEIDIVREIASTGSGTGAALLRRMSRRSHVRLAGHSECLRDVARVESVAPLLHNHLDGGGDVIAEGTQGFGLSLLHGPYYPNVTARDTTAAGVMSEIGLAPRDVTEVILVIRTFPIRVGGLSGTLLNEISWSKVSELSGAPEVIPEYTSVTKNLRRVGHFDIHLVEQVVRYNRPTRLAVMGLDRLDYKNHCATRFEDLTEQSWRFIIALEKASKVSVGLVGTGFATDEAFYRPITI